MSIVVPAITRNIIFGLKRANLYPLKSYFPLFVVDCLNLYCRVTGYLHFVQIALFDLTMIGVSKVQHDQFLSGQRMKVFVRGCHGGRGRSRLCKCNCTQKHDQKNLSGLWQWIEQDFVSWMDYALY